MRRKKLLLFGFLLSLLTATLSGSKITAQQASPFAGQDLHLVGKELLSYQTDTDEHALVFREGFSMNIGANQLSSDSAVVWLRSVSTEYQGRLSIEYNATVYLQGNVSVKKTARTTNLSQSVVEDGQSLLLRFVVTGEVFVTAEKRVVSEPQKLELYREALSWSKKITDGPLFVVQPEALVPQLPEEKKPEQKVWTTKGPVKQEVVEKEKEQGLLERIFEPQEKPPEPKEKEPVFVYPIVFAPAGDEPLKFDSTPTKEGLEVATIRQRFYVSQRQDEQGRLLELQADNAVVYYTGQGKTREETSAKLEELLSSGVVEAIYLSGDVVMTEGQRTVRADEVYYDFKRKKALAINAVMRNFDVGRGIPIYVRADKLRQLSENRFAADNITLTTSEFYLPQLSVNASSVIITDMTTVDEQLGKLSDSSYDAEMRDVKLKAGRRTIFAWPFMRANLQRPDVPIESAHAGYDNTWGMSLETRWYLARLLGLREAEGVESRLALDYFSKRGVGAGVDIKYTREDHFGWLSGYVIHDTGDDRLGRNQTRKDLEPPRKLRGRFSWLHRQFLPYNWQLTTGIDYSSDERFIEQYYRREFSIADRETYVHLKRSEDNWAVSILGKGRINDFDDELEELPTAEFHLTGQSFFDDRFTLYSDSQISHLRQRIGNEHNIAITQRNFSFISHRTELDMPIWMKPFKIVPYLAGMFGYDDRSGFTRTLVDGTDMGTPGTDNAWIGEAGIRVGTRLWKVYPDVKSRLWDLNQLRHIMEPHFTAVMFEENDLSVKQQDALNIGVTQRLQTKRGPAGAQRTVDWMRLDMEATFVDDSADVSDAGPGPDRFLWNKPIVPLRVLSAPDIFNGDLISGLQRFEMYGPRRDYFGADYVWRVSDTTAVLSDLNYDVRSGAVQQFDFGFTRLCWPDLSYYIGSRYLRRTQVLDETGSNAVTFSATYVLDPRYTIVFSQQYDFDYGANVRSEITLIRRYHRIYCGLTYSADQSLDTQAIVFSIWPQGVPEIAIGPRRYTEVGGSTSY